jgi:hypothetical protein
MTSADLAIYFQLPQGRELRVDAESSHSQTESSPTFLARITPFSVSGKIGEVALTGSTICQRGSIPVEETLESGPALAHSHRWRLSVAAGT